MPQYDRIPTWMLRAFASRKPTPLTGTELVPLATAGTQVLFCTTQAIADLGSGGGGGSSLTTTAMAGGVLGGHRVVRVDDTGNVVYADKDDGQSGERWVGLTTGSATMGSPVSVILSGVIDEVSWNWDMTKAVYLGNTGSMVQDTPLTGVMLRLGIPMLPTRLLISPEPPVYLS